MKYELIELNMQMGLLEYEMYQDIPLKGSGTTNLSIFMLEGVSSIDTFIA